MIKTEVLKIIKSENVNVINNIFEKYNFDEIFIKYNGEIIDYFQKKINDKVKIFK